MKKSIALVLSLIATSLVVACGGSDDKSTSGASCAAPEGTSDACFTCVKSSCGSEYSNYCGANCSTSSSSSACLDASTAIGTCAAEHCDSECKASDSGGEAGSSGTDTGTETGTGSAGETGSGATVTNAECKKLETCCVVLTTGPQEACAHVAGLNSGPSCLSTYSLYKCDAAIAAAGKPKTTACKIDTECLQGPYTSDAQATSCAQDEGGTASDTCPTEDVVGCCSLGGVAEICDYKGQRDSITEADCTAEGGTFSTTP